MTIAARWCRTVLAAAVLSAPLPAAAVPPAPGSLLAPVTPACVSSPFGPRRRIGPSAPAAFHRGIDLPAPAGAPVHAAAAGTVASIHRRGPGGLELILQHPDGWQTVYSHLGRVTPALAEGKSAIKAGEIVGVVGHSGVTYGMHLFFEVLVDGTPVDPAPLVNVSPCAYPR
jgi:murein DD-endopeptidase MepM/ murein hydrolase activator NlpD